MAVAGRQNVTDIESGSRNTYPLRLCLWLMPCHCNNVQCVGL